MALPNTTYDTATPLSPSAGLTDFTLMIDLSRLTAAWWAAVDTSDGTRGRAARDSTEAELACDWIDFTPGGGGAVGSGWLRVKFAGSLASGGSNTIRVYPPMAANDPVAAGDAFGSDNAYDADWRWYTPGHDLVNRIDSGESMTQDASATSSISTDGKTSGSLYYDGVGSSSLAYAQYIHGSDLNTAADVTLMAWTKLTSKVASEGGYPFRLAEFKGSIVNAIYPRVDSGDRWRCQIRQFGSPNQISNLYTTSALSGFDGAWSHLAIHNDGSGQAALVNGVQEASAGGYDPIYAGLDTLTLLDSLAGEQWAGEYQFHNAKRAQPWIKHEHDQTDDQAAFWGSWANTVVEQPLEPEDPLGRKVRPTPGNPLITLWGTPPASHPICAHPYVRWQCRTYEGSEQSHVLPHSAGLVVYPEGSTDMEESVIRVAQRLREHAQDQVALGATMDTLCFFIQNLGYGTSSKTFGTPLLCKAPDDQLASGSNPEDSIYAGKAADGTLSVESGLTPLRTAVALYRDQIQVELEGASLAAFGYFDDDCEDLHSPWSWCSGSGGNWTIMTGDARASTEVLCRSAYNISGDGTGDLTLDAWITDEDTNRNTSFDLINAAVDWRGGSNSTNEINHSLLRLRSEASQSQWGYAISDVMKTGDFWVWMKTSNYQIVGADNTSYPTLLTASGDEPTDHNTRYFPADCHSPVFYPTNNSDGTLNTGFARFSPDLQFDVGKPYSMQACLGSAHRQMMAIIQGSEGDKPVRPWIRGIDDRGPSRTPEVTVDDMAKLIRFCRGWPTVNSVTVWYDDQGGSPDYDAMYAAILKEYPL